MRSFLAQLKWEFVRLMKRPRTWLVFWLSLLFEVCTSVLLKAPGVRAAIARDIWKMREQWNDIFSGLTTAAHILGESFTIVGAIGIALVAAEIVAGENESGTLRMIFCRPAGRGRVLAAKLVVCITYAMVVVLYIAATTLFIGWLFEGPGNLVLLAPHEGIMGAFHFEEGLRRYALAVPLICFAAVSGMLWPFFFSCTGMKPATAAVLALFLLAADDILRTTPQTAVISPHCVTTRMLSWRQVFNDEIPWPRIERNYEQLAVIDAALLAGAVIAFRRLETRR
jgi:ABC-2 type transport system permease protein